MVLQPSVADGRLRRSIAMAVLAAAVAAGVAPGVVGASAPVLLSDPLPACERGDDPAPKREYGQWRSTPLDTRYRLPRGYLPPHLVSTARASTNGGSRVRRLVIDDLRAMVRAARRAGITIRVNSEPWHLRYYGRNRAAAIHESGLVAREWLWINAVAGAR